MKPALVVDRLEVVVGLAGAPRRLRSVIEAELAGHFGLSAIEAAERAESLEPKVAAMILARQQAAELHGTLCTLTCVGVQHQVLGSCHVQPTDAPAVSAAKTQRLAAIPLFTRIQNLTFNEFEMFAEKVLRELGARNTRVTRQSNDQGIDFYGILSLGQYQQAPAPFFKLAHDVELRFAGQAKHYPTNPIGTSVVRELVGAVSLARYKTFSVEKDLFEDLALHPLSPLACLLFTSGRLTSGASELAKKAGIVARSGEQLAVFLADRGVGMTQTAAGPVFDEPSFQAWLDA